MANSGETILATDYNEIRNKIVDVMGSGSASYGYGQDIISSPVSNLERVTKVQWDNLRFDIINARVHQTGELPSIVQVSTSDPIRYSAASPNYQYSIIADTARTERFNVGTGQFAITPAATRSTSASWNASQTVTLTVSFSTAQQARYFFNSGGKVRFSSTRSGGTVSQQNQAWTNLLSSAGTSDFGGNSPAISFYNLTNSPQTCFSYSATSPYSANTYRISAYCNVANNSGGTATQINFIVTYTDAYIDLNPATPPGDSVDGTLTLTVEQIKAAGTLLPVGTFSVTAPTYSITAFSGS